jgi:hypothetical protein
MLIHNENIEKKIQQIVRSTCHDRPHKLEILLLLGPSLSTNTSLSSNTHIVGKVANYKTYTTLWVF